MRKLCREVMFKIVAIVIDKVISFIDEILNFFNPPKKGEGGER